MGGCFFMLTGQGGMVKLQYVLLGDYTALAEGILSGMYLGDGPA